MMQDEYEAPFLDKFLKCLCSNSPFEFKKHLDDGRKHVFRAIIARRIQEGREILV